MYFLSSHFNVPGMAKPYCKLKLYLLQELYKSMLSYGMTSYNETCFMIAVILRPVYQTVCEKVGKSHFVLFDFNFLTKRDWSKRLF